MSDRIQHRLIYSLLTCMYVLILYFFYIRYVPLIDSFQSILLPILFLIFCLTVFNLRWGTLFFVALFPLINNLPYFFGIYGAMPHAPTALVLFLFYFLGWLVNSLIHKPTFSSQRKIFRPLFLFSILVIVSGIITALRYANFYPFLTDYVYELITNAFGVTSGGAIMSVIFNSLNYLTGFAFFCLLLSIHHIYAEGFMERTVIVLCVSTFLSLSFGLFQRIFDLEFGNNLISINHGLINATFKDALSFGAFLSMVVPLFLGVFFAGRGAVRVFSLVVVILSLYMLFFAGSKSGFIGVILSLCLFFLLAIKMTYKRKEKPIFLSLRKIWSSPIVISVLILAIILGYIIINKDLSNSKTITRLNYLFEHGVVNLTMKMRGPLWEAALLMMRDYPISGVGIGGYIIELANYSEMHRTAIQAPQSAENYFLQVGAEFGIIGLIVILWLFWEVLRQIKRRYLNLSPKRVRFILIGAIAGIISFFVNIQFHTYIGSFEINYTFWLLAAFVYCLGHSEQEQEEKRLSGKKFVVLSVCVFILFSGTLLWNSTHSLSLKSRTEKFHLKQNFGFYELEKTPDGRRFRWTSSYGGLTLKIEKSVIQIPLLASHPDIERDPVKVKIYLIKDFFKQKILLDECVLTKSVWNTYEYLIPQDINKEVILLFKISRTWNPQKALGAPDPRNLGIAVGEIKFREDLH